jgi:ribosomal-protein-alanine N-acetyltransferase
MQEAKISLPGGFSLSGLQPSDKPALLEHFQSKEIYDNTLNIPYPYTDADADSWIALRADWTSRQGKEASFAVRNGEGMLIGCVSSDHLEIGASHRAELGYWLARHYWGRGIMTMAVNAYVKYAFEELQVLRIYAHVFDSNPRSARVLEKNGFTLEGRLRHHLRKDGKLIDVRVYGLLKEDVI